MADFEAFKKAGERINHTEYGVNIIENNLPSEYNFRPIRPKQSANIEDFIHPLVDKNADMRNLVSTTLLHPSDSS